MTTATRRKALTVAQVYALPAMPTVQDAFAAIHVSSDLGYQMVRDGEFPIEVIKLGARALRVRRSDLLTFLGLENGEAAGGPAPTASSEQVQQSPVKRNGASS